MIGTKPSSSGSTDHVGMVDTRAVQTPASPVKIQVSGVYKVFGREPHENGPREHEAVRMLRQGAEKHEVHAATGTTVGLAGIDLDIPAERITCIMGLSGSGKSTLVRHLNRLIDPTVGTIHFDGVDILQLSLSELREWRRHRISMVFQNFGLLPHINVLDNVAFGLHVRGDPKAQARDTAREWLNRVGLREYETRYPDELSGGMRQRVGLARALAIDSDVLLMDEAFSALDPLIRYDLQDQLLELHQRLKKTIVFVTHDIDEALRLGQHVVILRDGKVEQVGVPEDIRQRPINEYVERFVRRKS